MDTTINRRTSSFVSYVVIAQSTNNSVFIVEQFFFLLIKYNYLEWTRKSCFNLLRFYCNEKKYLRAKLRVKTKRSSSKVNFSQDNIFFSKIVYVFKISSIAFSNLSTYSRLRFPRIFLEKKKICYRVGYRFVDFTGFTSDWIHPRGSTPRSRRCLISRVSPLPIAGRQRTRERRRKDI